MCGMGGIALREPRGVSTAALARMAAALRHRGPDGYGCFTGPQVGFAHTRLSILDLACGAQPMASADGRYVITYNGEIFNYLELQRELGATGARFRTHSDTEVLLHAWAAWGPDMLPKLNGQFALALFDRVANTLFLARDRHGVRPLCYAQPGGDLVFASEAKALFASGMVRAEPDLAGLDEVFTFWGARAPRTAFRGVSQLEPGSCAEWKHGSLRVWRWFELGYEPAGAEPGDALDQLDALLRSSVEFRLRADIPVGGYLSGGLDSSITCSLAAAGSPFALRTFSVTFDDPALDESAHQRRVAEAVGSDHAIQHIARSQIAEVFPDVVRHAESPLVRTAPAPMYLLARLARSRGISVVLTGEGADEVFLGYDIFKEAMVRRFALRQPSSVSRPKLLDRLYPYLTGGQGGAFWRKFFLEAGPLGDPLFSHLPRFALTSWIKEFYADGTKDALRGADPLRDLRDALPKDFGRWTSLAQAAWIESATLLSNYLLSAQGDRVAMAHGVEGRYPFLDHRVVAFAGRLPDRSKLRGLREKDILRRWAARARLPGLSDRTKQPYRAPDVPPFFAPGAPDYVRELLEPAAIRNAGIFHDAAVAGLVRRCAAGQVQGFRESQALVAILSTQLWHRAFIGQPAETAGLPLDGADVLLTHGEGMAA